MAIDSDGNIIIDVKIDDSGTSQSLGQVQNQLNQAGQEMDKTSQKAVSFKDVLKANLASELIVNSVKTLVNMIKTVGPALVETSAQVRAEEAQFEASFKNLQEAATDSFSQISKDTGVLTERLKIVGTQGFSQLKGAGLSANQALEETARFTEMAADAAAYYDISIEEASLKLRSFMRGNTEAGDSIGLFTSEAQRNAKAMEVYSQKYINLTEAQKQLLMLDISSSIYEASGAMGQAAREADGYENVLGNLKEQWRQLVAVAGESTLEAVVPVMQNITKSLGEAKPAVEQASEALGNLFTVIAGEEKDASKAIENLKKNLSALDKEGEAALKSLISGMERSMPLVGELAGEAVSKLAVLAFENADEIINAGQDTVLKFVDGINNNSKEITKAAVDMAVDVIEGALTKTPEFKAAGEELAANLIVGLTDALNAQAQSSMNAFSSELRAATENSENKFLDTGKFIGKKIIEGLALVTAITSPGLMTGLGIGSQIVQKNNEADTPINTGSGKTANELLEDFQDQQSKLRKETDRTNKNLDDLSQALGGAGNSASKAKKELTPLQQALKDLNNEIALTDMSPEDELKARTDIYNKFVGEYGESSQEMIDIRIDQHNLEKEIDKEREKDLDEFVDHASEALKKLYELEYDNQIYANDKRVDAFHEATKEHEKALKEEYKDVEYFSGLKEKSVTDEQKNMLKTLEDSMKDRYDLYSDAQYEELRLMEDTTKDWLKEYDYLTDEQLDIAKSKKSEEIEFIRTENEKLAAEIEQYNKELSEALSPLLDRENEITEAQRQRKAQREQERREERLAALRKKIDEEEDYDRRKGYERDLEKLQQEYADKDLEAQENAELKEIQEEKKRLIEERNEKVAAAQEKLAENTEKIAGFMEEILANFTSIGAETAEIDLNEKSNNAEEAVKVLMDGNEENHDLLKQLLEKFAPKYEESGKELLSSLRAGIKADQPEFVSDMTEGGVNAIDGVIKGMLSKEEDAKKAAKKIAEAINKAFNDTLEIHSPSRVGMRSGSNLGEGWIIGAVNKVNELMPKIRDSALGIDRAFQNAGANISSGSLVNRIYNNNPVSKITNQYDYSMALSFDSANFSGNQDVYTLSQELDFIRKQKMLGKGVMSFVN